MIEQIIFDDLFAAQKDGYRLRKSPVTDRLVGLSYLDWDRLACYSILGVSLDLERLEIFFKSCEELLLISELPSWLVKCVKNGLVRVDDTTVDNLNFPVEQEVYEHFLTAVAPEDSLRYHACADKFFEGQLSTIAVEMEIELPEDPLTRRKYLIGPDGFLWQISHLPQYQEFHQTIVSFAANWHEHHFQLKRFEEAADVLNSVCFALSRRGERRLAENLLARMESVSKGRYKLVAKINLATLLREEHKLDTALKLYYQVIPGLIWSRAFLQLAMTIAEIGAIYRHKGKLVRAVMILEFSVLLNGWLKNYQGAAIANSLLASTYRYLKMYKVAIETSQKAIDYFRETNDMLNLGRSLVTLGSIYNFMRRPENAMDAYDEALQIGQQIVDPQTICRSIGGKAAISMQGNQTDEAQGFLEEAIGLKERYFDYTVGIEYENLGSIYNKRGNLPLALVWYRKALEKYKKYMPVEVAACQNKFRLIEKMIEKNGK